ncbi:MAG: alpha/beta fold hydrolase [Deltaproteobacteria bacterium]|nr:alpha/beta fold hydrolase [Deltaproteobacteria bacterium]
MNTLEVRERDVSVGDLTIHYREAGEGPAVLLLHGWPTSSYLWREVLVPIARTHRVLAPDLPGFGASSKPRDRRYTFGFYRDALDGFLRAVGVDDVGLVVHDLGGPVGLSWAVRQPSRVRRLALLNTLVFPRPSLALLAFLFACRAPLVRGRMISAEGLRFAMRLGMTRRERLTPEVLDAVQAPFRDPEDARSLLRAVNHLSPLELVVIARRLANLTMPVRVVYGARDRILPDVARTMAKVKRVLPQAQVTELPGVGHFLQEDAPEEVGALLAEFFAQEATAGA